MAAALAEAINTDGVLGGAGISATNSSAVISILTQGPDQIPTITAWVTQAAAIFTITGSVTTGDVLNIKLTNTAAIGGSYTFQYRVLSTDTTLAILATSITAAINNNATLVSYGFAATNPSSAVVHLTWNGAIGPVTIAVSENGVETATIGGSAQATDIVNVIIHDSGLVSNPATMTYTVGNSDTLDTIAAGIEALINADSNLTALGITATVSGAIVSITSTSHEATTYTQSVTGTDPTETVTLAGGPTETNTVTGSATETLTVSNDSGGTETFTLVQPVGGSGAVIPQLNFVLNQAVTPPTGIPPAMVADQNGVSTQNFWRGQPCDLDYNTLSAIIAAGESII
jgi:hypothetical protein